MRQATADSGMHVMLFLDTMRPSQQACTPDVGQLPSIDVSVQQHKGGNAAPAGNGQVCIKATQLHLLFVVGGERRGVKGQYKQVTAVQTPVDCWQQYKQPGVSHLY